MKFLQASMISILFYIASSTHIQAAKLWSNEKSFLGSGLFYGPGSFTSEQPLFEIELNNLSFFNSVSFVTPFINNGDKHPNICGEKAFRGVVDGKLSNGLRINENANMCVATIAGTNLLVGVVEGGPHMGQQFNVALENGDIVMTMDLALDLGIGEDGIIHLPFYGTTGELIVPKSYQSIMGRKGVDQAGIFGSGTLMRGRIGDFNNDGWIDGTLVAVGNMPLDSPLYAGQPYAMHRNFETNIPISGLKYANIKGFGVKRSKEP